MTRETRAPCAILLDRQYSAMRTAAMRRNENAFRRPKLEWLEDRDLLSKLIVPDVYPTIQAAMAVAKDGDTVFARAGHYKGPIFISRNVDLFGEGPDKTII